MSDEYETLYQAQGAASSVTTPRNEAEAPFGAQRRGSHSPLQAGRNADGMDLAGVGEAKLECTVTHPLKENDGSKDAYMSYLVTTIVGFLCPSYC
jgi:sorting nexin-4